ncbi:MAG: nucleotide exchange factor GrpE [Planctomycetes bacterium]|jgi:molecular chaperone GrpE|nr:nucleotide exchange factor GrpE [Phycisphaerae bacterium]NBB94224.1 nucleotide exchange factor GrpE [Planctomycetota bacterium]
MTTNNDSSEPKEVKAHGPGEPADPDAPAEENPPPGTGDAESAEPVPEAAGAEIETDSAEDLHARLQRLAADYQNFKKRAAKEKAQAREFANESLLKELLPVIDDMERALAAARQNHDENDPFLQGMQLVHDKTIEVLGRFGLTRIDAVGQPFDPDRHAAMMQEASETVEPMTVLREVQTGYDLKGRTLRPTGVVVSKAPDES